MSKHVGSVTLTQVTGKFVERKPPHHVDAVRWTGTNWPVVSEWLRPRVEAAKLSPDDASTVVVWDDDARMVCRAGMWIVQGTGGEISIMGADRFDLLYAPARAEHGRFEWRRVIDCVAPSWVQVLDGQVMARLEVDDVAAELNALVAAVEPVLVLKGGDVSPEQFSKFKRELDQAQGEAWKMPILSGSDDVRFISLVRSRLGDDLDAQLDAWACWAVDMLREDLAPLQEIPMQRRLRLDRDAVLRTRLRAVLGRDHVATDVHDQPSPVPQPDRIPVWENVISDFRHRFADNFDGIVVEDSEKYAGDHVVTDMRERDRVGRERYGTPLTTGNGRDHLVDAYQELLDGAVYLKAAVHEGAQVHEAYYEVLDLVMAIRKMLDKAIEREAACSSCCF